MPQRPAPSPKNPRRVAGYHWSRFRKARRSLWWLLPATVLPLTVAVASFWAPVPGWVRVTCWTLAGAGVITLAESCGDAVYHARRVARQGGGPPP